MSQWHDDEFRPRRDVVAIPTIWVAFALSLIVHVAALWEWLPRMRHMTLDALAPSEANAPLAVRLVAPQSALSVPTPASPPSPERQPQRPPVAKSRPPKAVPRAPPAPPVIAVAPPAPGIALSPPASPPVASPTTPTPPGPPLEGDLSSYIAARRRARGETESSPSPGTTASVPVEDDIARRDRIVASNLAPPNSQTFGELPKNSGGIFGITRLGYTDAEFTFFGWNKDIRRRASQRIEVRQGDNSDIRVAVIRRMIAIIREYEQEDFVWESRRLGRNVSLSARLTDNAELENFMMREFFDASGLLR